MGGPFGSGPPFGMLTRKSVSHLSGNHIWVIEGRGKKKQYFLKNRFLVDSVDEIDDDYFTFEFSGTDGVNFDPEIPLSPYPWFKAFLKAVANFSIGVTTLKPEYQTRFLKISGLNESESQQECESDWEFVEGEIRTTTRTFKARNSAARQACIDHFGTNCFVCGFDFGLAYGKGCLGFIEVHHRDPMARSDGSRVVRPTKDLVPICPNCHRALHILDVTVEELQRIWKTRIKRP